MQENIKLKTVDGFTVNTKHTKANGKSVVLWLHGITVNSDEYLNFFKDGALYLEKCSIDSVRIDFRGHGKSSGSSMDLSIVGQSIDVDSAIKYIVEFYKGKEINISIVGCSFGAPPALFAANKYPEIVKKVILISPVLSYTKTFLYPETDWGKSIFNEKTLAKLNKTNKLYVEDKFPICIRLVEEMRLIDPTSIIKKIKQNVLIIHGDADSMVPYSVSYDTADSNYNVKLITMEQMGHGFMDTNDEQGTNSKSIENKYAIYNTIKEQVI